MRVVGTWTTGMPRMKTDARKPPQSPTTPPPNATNNDLRSAPALTSCSANCSIVARRLAGSPSFISSQQVESFARAKDSSSAWPQWRRTVEEVTTNTREPCAGIRRRSSRPTRRSSPAPTTTLYGWLPIFTGICFTQASKVPRSTSLLVRGEPYEVATRFAQNDFSSSIVGLVLRNHHAVLFCELPDWREALHIHIESSARAGKVDYRRELVLNQSPRIQHQLLLPLLEQREQELVIVLHIHDFFEAKPLEPEWQAFFNFVHIHQRRDFHSAVCHLISPFAIT